MSRPVFQCCNSRAQLLDPVIRTQGSGLAWQLPLEDRNGRRPATTSNTAADILIETIQDWGVEVIFDLPRDGIKSIMEALRKRKDRVRFVQARHEEADCGRIIGEALSTPGPVIVEGVVDPLEPPLPPKITMEQAALFAKSLVRGEQDGGKIAHRPGGANPRAYLARNPPGDGYAPGA
jgi:Thiamine pyrophosphate enzyme, N-terminal TPP binding domain